MLESRKSTTWLHRLAVLTACTALLPIAVGALVTSMDAGMAFSDWPTSDGQNMLLYPWMQSAGDKFIEHGHRLAGMLIGFVSILLVVVAWKTESRGWVKWATAGVLMCVIGQGLLGGGRVRLDARVLAMFHGQFAAWVFALMTLVAVWTSKNWLAAGEPDTPGNDNRGNIGRLGLKVCGMTAVIVVLQFALGGRVRHLHTSLFEHLFIAFAALVFVLLTSQILLSSGSSWLRRTAIHLRVLVVLQFLIGAGAWITRFGFGPTGYVATHHGTLQVWVRTSHTVVGMLLFATVFVAFVKTARVARVGDRAREATGGFPLADAARHPRGGLA